MSVVSDSVAYDYDAQEWLQGQAADELRRAQIEDELDLLSGPEGERYARFIGIGNRQAVIEALQAQLAQA